MTEIVAVDAVEFPLAVALRATGGPVRRTEIVTLGSGREVRNARWADSRRRWDAGSGVRSLDDLHTVLAFFEARRGRLHGFLFRDPLDDRSCAPAAEPGPLDQTLGVGDGAERSFPLTKTYGDPARSWTRGITRPRVESVRIAVDGVEKIRDVDFSVSAETGVVGFVAGSTPAIGAVVTAGYRFLVPARFDADEIRVDLTAFLAGEIPTIPIVELRG